MFNFSKKINSASFWAEQHLAWYLLPWPQNTSPVKDPPNRMGLIGLRKERVSAVHSSGKEDFQLGLLEQRVENRLSTKEGTEKRFHLQHIWYSVVVHKPCFLALEAFCSRPNSAWNPINIKHRGEKVL